MSLLTIENSGQILKATSYWDSEHAKAGLFYLTWNAGAGRLLVPDIQKPVVRELRSAKYVIVSRGPWAERGGADGLELLFEDNTDSPFCIHLSAEQTDRMLPDADQGGGFVIAVWTRHGIQLRLSGRYRKVPKIPDVSAWVAH